LNRYPEVTQSDAQYAVIAHAATGNNEIVAGVSRKKIRVLGYFFLAASAVTARWESGPGGTALSGQMSLDTGALLAAAEYNPLGWFETAVADPLNLELSSAVSVDGALVYVLV
jgi:hypothetical protein